MKILFFTLLIYTSLFGETILKIATYNVENLFDLETSGYEYSEYIPNSTSEWNQKNYKIKLKNIAQVIKDIDADIIALEEVESLQALLDLRFALKQSGLYYGYYSIADKKNTTVKVALLSKVPFVYSKEISVTQTYEYRNILETKFNINGKELYIFVNHWKSKSGAESQRVLCAKSLMKRVKEIGFDKNIILLGDFNSDYEEYLKFAKKREHNDTDGITGINHILGTINQRNSALHVNYQKESFYNLWYDTDEDKRYSYLYRGKKEVLDNILISQSLLNAKDVSYIHNTISNFNKEYLFKKNNIYRWQISKARVKKHKGQGYSDHLPLVARFRVD
ncbi:Endonuclease/exonuclease/phosphatase [Sulfurimonas denitrificans DSM 1251]|uniref:Endonuclease/exonuclease/phosphatase n=1 Tax=Sulfurimonas denitrificans (strain ATCC 33889 / DSM 1251) TaxID=326298 RepID=Q30SP1_SULDN|nr:endonuclease/exonuclease/phosphatase family protein [Sulfurimonas denitrificans]ABB43990.1 Endonuclease/exonuclease/phosphatase [Sulfurimonas denitrificans DSM 1251]MDD3443120.1 endonuclease/exonuclease/phosphatase family protein [Sulfurimonas denitrificans]